MSDSKCEFEKGTCLTDTEFARLSAFMSLCDDYDSVFLIDVDTDRIEDLKVGELYANSVVRVPQETSFRARVQDGIMHNIVPEDRERIAREFDASSIFDRLKDRNAIFSIYRVKGNGSRGIYHRAKFVRVKNTDRNLLILGIKDSDKEIRIQHQQLVALQGLAYDFECVFYIVLGSDASSDTIRELRTSESVYKIVPGLENEKSLKGRLELLRNEFVCPEHRDHYDSLMNRELILKHFETSPVLYINFKAVDNHYYQIKLTADTDGGKTVGIIFGIQNIDVPYRDELDRRKRIEELVAKRTAELTENNKMLNRISEGVLELMGEMVEKRNEESGAHIHRVKLFTRILSECVMREIPRYGLTERDVSIISYVSPLHDFGKIMIPDHILTKPGKLTNEEFDIVKTHCEVGYSLIEKMESVWSDEYINVAKDVCLYHHEKWNGEGYPKGLKGDEIPISAQIVSIADIYDALTTERCYKHAFSPEIAFQMILDGKCGSFSEDMLRCLKLCRISFERCAEKPEEFETGIGSEMEVRPLFSTTEEIGRYNLKLKEQNKKLIDQRNDFYAAMPVIERLMNSMPGGFFVYHADGAHELIFFNDQMVQLFGCESKADFIEYTGNSFDGIVHPDDLDETQRSIYRQINETPRRSDHVVYRIVRKSGEVRWIDDYGQLTHSSVFGDIFYVFILDVTENYNRRKKALLAEMAAEQERFGNTADMGIPNSGKLKRLSGMKILLVDDEDLSRELNKELLCEEGAVVYEACNGLEAVQAVKESGRFDLVLTDIIMPVMNGVDAIREICTITQRSGQYTPVIALTAIGSDSQVKDAIRAGAVDCLYKPLNIHELVRVLLSHMTRISSDMERKIAETMKLANTDILTSVKNIIAFTEEVSRLSAEMESNPDFDVGIVICDCDGLKLVNDTLGHDVGDQFIKNNCRIITSVFSGSSVYRIGGDEFAVVVRGNDLKNADNLMKQMKLQSLEASRLPHISEGKACFSCGFSRYSHDSKDSISDIMKRADRAMYLDKSSKIVQKPNRK